MNTIGGFKIKEKSKNAFRCHTHICDKATSRPVSSLRLIDQVLAAVQGGSWALQVRTLHSSTFHSSSLIHHQCGSIFCWWRRGRTSPRSPLPPQPGPPRLNKNETNPFHWGSRGAIRRAKHTGPIIGVSCRCVFGARQITAGCRRGGLVALLSAERKSR